MKSLRPENHQGHLLKVQLERLRRMGSQLKGFLCRYHKEPQTQEQFAKREMLRARLQKLEKRCNEFWASRESDQMLWNRSGEDLDLLIREFRNLELQVKGFMQQQNRD